MNKKIIKSIFIFLIMFSLFYIKDTVYAEIIKQGRITTEAGLRMRAAATTNSTHILTVPYNKYVRVLETSNSGNGCGGPWVKVSYSNQEGYVCSDYLEISEVQTSSGNSSTTVTVTNEMSNMSDAEFENYLNSQGFPESYKVKLREVHKKHPSWIFIGTKTNRTWAEAMYLQDEFVSDGNDSSPGNSFLNINPTKANQGYEGYLSTQPNDYDYYTNTFKAHDGVYWFQANSAAVAHYMDPRKYLTEYGMFAFQDLSYDSSYQTEELVKKVLGNNHLTQFSSYFIKAAQQNNTSPIYLAALARQEVGTTSTNVCSNGNAGVLSDGVDYTGYYNFYNIGASSSPDPKLKSLQTAKANGWNSAEKSIVEGAYVISKNYIQCGQHTTYYQKFNFSPIATKDIWHQYTTNIDALEPQSISAYNSYSSMGLADLPFKFDIPIFEDMPESTPAPSLGNPNNYLSYIKVNGLAVTNFDAGNTEQNIIIQPTNKITVEAGTVSATASVTQGTGEYDFNGSKNITITVRAANGATRDYHLAIRTSDYKLAYSSHVMNIGWQNYALDGMTSGTTGQELRVEAMKIKLGKVDYQGNIEYKSFIEGTGWENTYKKNDEISGTTGQSKRIEAIKIKLTGEISNHYDIYYRVHVQNFGWLGWARNGEVAGNFGYGYRIEAIEIMLVGKGNSVSGYGSQTATQGNIVADANDTVPTNNNPTTLQVPDKVIDNTPEEIKLENVISSSSYKQDGVYLNGIALNTDVNTLINNLKKYNNTVSINIKDKNGNTKSSGIIGTGDKIEINTGSSTTIVTAIIFGDISGDGQINEVDLLKVKKHILGLTKQSGAFEKACDINKDGKVDEVDLLKVKKHILGLKSINQ